MPFLLASCAETPKIASLPPIEMNPQAIDSLQPTPIQEFDADFVSWRENFKTKATANGIEPEIFEQAFAGVVVNKKVIELDKKQPEKKITHKEYQTKIINDARINEARKQMRENSALLEEIGRKYGVQPRYIVALWAVESNFGRNQGKSDVIRSLATLAFEGRRREFFETELIEALRILQQGHIARENFIGSWAGALGQCQFMPSSFMAYAVDYDGDGKKDIWGNKADVFASIANYLKKSGWKEGQSWGRRVQAPEHLQPDDKALKSLSQWNNLGVRQLDGSALPEVETIRAAIIKPRGADNHYLVYDNFRVIMKWNRSNFFATSIGEIADRI